MEPKNITTHVRLTVEPKDERDFAVRTIAGIIRQNGFGYEARTESCKYRTDKGAACAIGLWIPDTAPTRILNYGGGVESLFITAKMEDGCLDQLGLFPALYNEYHDMANNLQLLHDSAAGGIGTLDKEGPVIERLRKALAYRTNQAYVFRIDDTMIDDAVKLAASEEML